MEQPFVWGELWGQSRGRADGARDPARGFCGGRRGCVGRPIYVSVRIYMTRGLNVNRKSLRHWEESPCGGTSDAGAGASPDWTETEVRLAPRRTLKIEGNGSELTTLYHPLSGLLAETVYFVHFRVKRTQSGPSGLSDELRVEIVDAIDGSVTVDPAGTSNSLVIDAKAISTATHESKWFSFRLRRTATQPIYPRLRISSPLAAGRRGPLRRRGGGDRRPGTLQGRPQSGSAETLLLVVSVQFKHDAETRTEATEERAIHPVRRGVYSH